MSAIQSESPAEAATPDDPDADGVRARQQAAVAALGVRALAGASLAALLDDAVAVVAAGIATECVKVVELLPDDGAARVVAGIGWTVGYVGEAVIDVGRNSQAGYALLSRAPVIVDDLRRETRFDDPPLLREHGIVSGISVILFGARGEPFGVLGAHTTRRRQFTGDDVNFLQSVANVLSAAMQRQDADEARRRVLGESEAFAHQLQEQAAELEVQSEQATALAAELELANESLRTSSADAVAAREASERAGARARRLLAVSSGLNEATTPEQVAEVIFREGMAAVGADAGSLALASRTGADGNTEFEIVRTRGYATPLVERYRRFPLAAGRPVSDAVLSGEPLLLGDAAAWRARYPDVDLEIGGASFEAFAAVPVMSGSEALAALAFAFARPVVFDDATRTFLATLGEQCGLALERARGFEREQRAREGSVFLADASRLLADSLDYEETLRRVAEAAVPQLGDWCAVDVVRDPTAPSWPPSLERLAIVHRDPARRALADDLQRRYPTDWNAPGGLPDVMRDGTELFVPVVTDEMLVAAAQDAEHLALLRELELRSVLIVPMAARGRTLGALTFVFGHSGRTFDERDLRLARDLAHRAALAIDNARLYRAADVARAAAEDANRSKSQFLATMSHELRTPLNAIAGHVQLLELGLHGPLNDAQRETLGRVTRAERHLLGLINDVLNYARIESGRLEYEVKPERLDQVLADVRSMVEPQLAEKAIQLTIAPTAAGDGTPLEVWADCEKLTQVLLNLLSNAVKFTPAGGHVDISVGAEGGRAGPLRLLVRDDGVGIPDDKLEAIFEPFVQVRSGFTRESGGTGLGLAISRDLARGMGGDLTAESTPGAGSVFALTLRRVVARRGA